MFLFKEVEPINQREKEDRQERDGFLLRGKEEN